MSSEPSFRAIVDVNKHINSHWLQEQASTGLEFGKDAYRLLQMDDLIHTSEYILFRVSKDCLNIRWYMLHDGYQYLALQQPTACILSDETPPSPLKNGPLRVLLTIGALENQTVSDDAVIEAFAENVNSLVQNREYAGIDLAIVHEVTINQLLRTIQDAQSTGQRFHIWHHVGAVSMASGKIELILSDGTLKHDTLYALVNNLSNPSSQKSLRLLVLHTPNAAPLNLFHLADIPAPGLIGIEMGPHSEILIQGLYQRLLKHDLATTVFLARLDSYINQPQSNEWMNLAFLSRSRPLQMVEEHWRQRIITPHRKTDLPCFLFLRANPINAQHGMLPLDRELKKIKQALSHCRQDFVWRDEGALEPEDFIGFLLETRPNLLHFSGHGSTRGSLLWETSDSMKRFVQPERIIPVLTQPQFKQLRCVVLNACYTDKFADLLRPHDIVAVGMQDTVSDTTAIHFAGIFYQTLAHGENVARAFDLACASIPMLGEPSDADKPQISDYEAAKQITFFRQRSY